MSLFSFFHFEKNSAALADPKIDCPLFVYTDSEAVPIGDGMQIGKKNFCLARKKLAGILTDFKSF